MLPRLWRLLLRAAPEAVRREYAEEMETVLRHCLETERAQPRPLARGFIWLRALADVLWFAAAARWHRWGATNPEAVNRSRRPLVITRDIRQTLRLMRGQPALAAAIVLMLALGIGATTAIFSVVHGVLLRPLPFPEPDRLVQIWGTRNDRGWSTVSLTEANFWDLRDRNHTFQDFGTLRGASFSLTGFEVPERVAAGQVSVGFMKSLGVRPIAGRIFEKGEDEPGRGDGIVLISHAFWSRHFGADTSVIGRSLTLDGRPYAIVGILMAGSPWLDTTDVFVPFARRPNADRGSFEYTAIGRLKPGVTIDGARTDLAAVSKELETQYPATNTGLGAAVEPSSTWVASDDLRRTLWILLGAVGLLLAIACVNVTNLLLARASARARENAVRTALGASRADLVRERLTESLLYSAGGTLVGWFVARWMLGTLQANDPGGIPRLAEVTLNGWVLAFAAGSAVFVGVVTGLLPALRTPLGNVARALGQSGRTTTSDRAQQRLRAVFVGAEIALSLVLLVGAGLLVRSLFGVMHVERGFQTENRLLITVSVPPTGGPDRMRQTVRSVIEGIKALPDVISVAAVSGRPLGRFSTGLGIGAANQPDVPGAAVPWATWRVVTPDYFKAMGLRLIAGRNFADDEVTGKPWRAIVSKRVADLLWPGQNPIGRTAILWKGQGNTPGEIVGVVGDMRERGIESDPTLAVYFPGGSTAFSSLPLVIHTKGRPEAIVPAVRTVVAGVDRTLPISSIRTLDEMVTASLATRRMTMLLIATFAVLALVLAVAGVYGVLAYTVARRTSEIGVRIALGAPHRGVLWLVVLQGMRPVFAGAAVGLAATFWLSQLMSSLLFGIQPRDPLTYGAVAAVLLGVAVLACYLPARSVLAVDPAIALRSE